MRSTPRILAVIFFGLVSCVVLASFVRASALGGWIGVRVQDEDVDFAIHLPAALARAALVFVPNEVWQDARADIGEWGPAVHSAFGELETCDDAVLVEVESDQEYVLVRKSGGRFLISVATPDEQVEIRIPTRLVRAVWDRVAGEPHHS